MYASEIACCRSLTESSVDIGGSKIKAPKKKIIRYRMNLKNKNKNNIKNNLFFHNIPASRVIFG